MKKLVILVISFSFAAVCMTSCATESKPGNANVNSVNTAGPAQILPSATVDEFASGRKVYASSCAGCHKESGTGGEVEIEGKKIKPDDLTSAKIKGFSDDKILGYIMNGVPDEGMPAFKGKLSESEMRDVVKYIRIELQKMPAQSPKK